MDAVSLSTSLAAAGAANQINVSVLKALQGLDQNVAAELFGSLGLGTVIDARA